MQGFRYAPDLVEFAHMLAVISPRAFVFVKHLLPLPEIRTLRQAMQPHFPVDITERSFDLLEKQLKLMQWHGPLTLSCDDTKLLPAFRPFFDHDLGGFVILGAAGKPVLLPDPSLLAKVIEENGLVKATKLRLWCVQANTLNITPIVFAVTAFCSSSAQELYGDLAKVIAGFILRGIKVHNYACDGTAVAKRSVEELLDANATKQVNVHTIKHPGDPAGIPVILHFHDHPIATMQDSKHGRKTARNNLCSGARLLTLPNDVALYRHMLQLVAQQGPLFWRDVRKMDKQDDRAAARWFSAAVLEWLVNHHPEHRATIIFLFIFGELIDAYQNRHISHVERVQMVLRAHFFLNFWEKFLARAGYPRNRYFISNDFAIIVRILVSGFLQTLFIYRDHLHGDYPLFWWLLSTEPDEHVFGISRDSVRDFTLLNFYESLPKFSVRLREDQYFNHASDSSSDRARGYHHTYTDSRDVDIAILSVFPTNQEIDTAAELAYKEVENLCAFLGVLPHQLQTDAPLSLPQIADWLIEPDGDTAEIENGELDLEESPQREAYALLDELEGMMDSDSLTKDQEDEVMRLRLAQISLEIDEVISRQSMPEYHEDQLVEKLVGDADRIKRMQAAHLKPLKMNEPDKRFPIIDGLHSVADLSALVQLRFRHQTREAKATRQSAATSTDPESTLQERQPTEREKEYQKIVEAVRQQRMTEEKGIGTGLSRRQRHITEATHEKEVSESTGNARNAAEKAARAATQVMSPQLFDHLYAFSSNFRR
ncbi:hypothetical protein F5890DRAFT_1421718 [Lentinula detonsa]|uniref:Uncharacterized protein n=1 Tax=Lentinula detonsa TaxID=2804962 RepID=A0AA38PP71_9AGAR|nr:hypothetical protein F5890DRAFT_1421718 [Lentinula detonsa]